MIRAALVACALATPAAAHMAASGWAYDMGCCSDQDCEPIPAEWVTVTPEGYLVRVPAGEHSTATQDHEKLFPYDKARKSGDEHYHGCITPRMQNFICLYVPEFGA